ncbi:MAG: peptide ABC transporter substrate-binding protein [Chloroflexota bacterium]
MRHSRIFFCIAILTILGLVLSACEIEGGVPTPTVDMETPPDASTNEESLAAIEAREDTWSIGLINQPQNLYPYHASPTTERVASPITELLFPAPVLAYSYGYTTTEVLEQIPTLDNGGAEIQPVDVYLDAAGEITTTVTDVITQVDQLVVTYRWNPELHWSDGTPVTSEDSVFAYELARAAPPNNTAIDRLAQTVSYEAIDEHTTRAILQPDLTGVTYFLNYWTPLPRHLLEGMEPAEILDSDFARQPIGYGPYAIEERTTSEIRLVRNEHYFGPTPTVSEIAISFLPNLDLLRANILNGNLDVAMTDQIVPEQFEQLDQDVGNEQLQVTYTPNTIWEHIDFNLDVQLLQDIRVRRAILLGTNRQGMVNTIFDGHTPVLDSWVLPNQPEAAPSDGLTQYPYNPDAARELLDEGDYIDTDEDGIRSTSEGFPLTLELLTTDNTNNPVRSTIAEQFTQNMQEIGIDVIITEVPASDFFSVEGPLQRREFEMALFGWGASPNAGGLSLWSCNAIPSEQNGWRGENFSGWCFRNADRAIRTGVTTLDSEERRAAYIDQQEMWTREIPAMPLFQRLNVTLAAPNVQGIQPDTFAPLTWNITEWQRGEE